VSIGGNGKFLPAAQQKGTRMICIANLEAALIGADLNVLDDVSRQLWAAYSAGDVTDRHRPWTAGPSRFV
jgi:hypothetical protein